MIYSANPSDVHLETPLVISQCVSLSRICITCEMMCIRNCRANTTARRRLFMIYPSRNPFGRVLRKLFMGITVYFNIHNVYHGRHDAY